MVRDRGEGQASRERSGGHGFGPALARAFAGAILFSVPLLMTREMWRIGATPSELRLALLMVLMIPLLIALDRLSGFRSADTWAEDVLDGLVAYGVGLVAAAAALTSFGVIGAESEPLRVVGRVALEAVPASYGAVLANSQLAETGDAGSGAAGGDSGSSVPFYLRELFLMGAGSLFFAFQMAPTEEVQMIAAQMSRWHLLLLLIASVLLVHAFVYRFNFKGQHEETGPAWSVLARYSVVGYVVAVVISGYVLWTFGRFDGLPPLGWVGPVIVLGFPASLGAAAARLLL